MVIVGAGISGLAAACFWQQPAKTTQKILILDNHDDFAGHAKRNEFTASDGIILSYGGSESFQSPKHLYSQTLLDLLANLSIDIDQMARDFDVNFYLDRGLSRGVYFDKTHFGVDKLISGNPRVVVADEIPPNKRNGRVIEDYINDFPIEKKRTAKHLLLCILPLRTI